MPLSKNLSSRRSFNIGGGGSNAKYYELPNNNNGEGSNNNRKLSNNFESENPFPINMKEGGGIPEQIETRKSNASK